MTYDFERFTQIGRTHRPRVSITKQGLISLNRGCWQRYDIGSYDHVVLLWDRQRQAIGIMLTHDPDEEGAIRLRQRNQGADISARGFLEFCEIPYGEETQRYDPTLVTEDGHKIIVVNLQRTSPGSQK